MRSSTPRDAVEMGKIDHAVCVCRHSRGTRVLSVRHKGQIVLSRLFTTFQSRICSICRWWRCFNPAHANPHSPPTISLTDMCISDLGREKALPFLQTLSLHLCAQITLVTCYYFLPHTKKNKLTFHIIPLSNARHLHHDRERRKHCHFCQHRRLPYARK